MNYNNNNNKNNNNPNNNNNNNYVLYYDKFKDMKNNKNHMPYSHKDLNNVVQKLNEGQNIEDNYDYSFNSDFNRQFSQQIRPSKNHQQFNNIHNSNKNQECSYTDNHLNISGNNNNNNNQQNNNGCNNNYQPFNSKGSIYAYIEPKYPNNPNSNLNNNNNNCDANNYKHNYTFGCDPGANPNNNNNNGNIPQINYENQKQKPENININAPKENAQNPFDYNAKKINDGSNNNNDDNKKKDVYMNIIDGDKLNCIETVNVINTVNLKGNKVKDNPILGYQSLRNQLLEFMEENIQSFVI